MASKIVDLQTKFVQKEVELRQKKEEDFRCEGRRKEASCFCEKHQQDLESKSGQLKRSKVNNKRLIKEQNTQKIVVRIGDFDSREKFTLWKLQLTLSNSIFKGDWIFIE